MDEQATEVNPAGGMAALTVAQSHLSTLLSATDTLDSKASLIIAVNVALFGVFFGALISATDPTPWIAITPSGTLFGFALFIGGLTLRPRPMGQFVAPDRLMSHMTGEYENDALAWSYVRSIQVACVGVNEVIDEKVIGLAALAILTISHIAAAAASTAVWIP
jgi:hypothetical protein